MVSTGESKRPSELAQPYPGFVEECPREECNGRLYIDSDGDRRCFTCGRSPDLPTSLPPGGEPKSSDGRHGAEAIGRSYRRRQSEKTGVKRGDPVMLKEREVKDPRPGLDVAKEPEVEREPKQKRQYRKTSNHWSNKGKESASISETAQEPFEQTKSGLCLGCPAKIELQRLRVLLEGYRLAISDLGGHNGTD